MPEQQRSSRFEIFVGREREFVQLRDALEEASDGRGRLLLISGEPGIGKTRLADQVARLAQERNARMLWGRCWEGGGAPPYWPWIQIVRALIASLDPAGRELLFESEHAVSMVETIVQIVPELFAIAPRAARPQQQAHNDARQSQFRLFDSVATLLRDTARLAPLVIVLDDLHDADIGSLTMLRFVARELRASAILIVGTYRDTEVQRSPAVNQQIGGLSRDARTLALGGLSAAEVAEYFNKVVGEPPGAALAGRLYEATAGNPLFVDGLVRGLIAQRDQGRDIAGLESFSTSHDLREAIARRLEMLSDGARAVLEAAAAIGNEFDSVICARVREISPEQLNSLLDEAARDGIVMTVGQGRYRFAHALIRTGVYTALDTNNRIRLHGLIAAAIEAQYADKLAAHLDELAHHFREANIADKAIDYSHRAALAAYRVFAFLVAAAHWRAALALTEGRRDLCRADILFGLGQTEAYFLDPPRGIAHLEEALKRYRELNEDAQVAMTHVALGIAQVFLPDFAPQMNVARALEHFTLAQEWPGEWNATSRSVPNKWSLGWLHRGKSVALFHQVRIEEALTSARRALQIWREASIPDWVSAAAFVAQLLTIEGRHRESAAMLREVTTAVQEDADPGLFHTALFTGGWINMLMRNPVEAQPHFATGATNQRIAPQQREMSFEFLAYTEILLGNLVRARELAATHRMNPSFRGVLAQYDGDLDKALESRRTMLEWAKRGGHQWGVVDTSLHLASSLYLAGDPVQALSLVEEAIGLYDPTAHLIEMGLRPLAALLEVEMGRPERAAEHLEICRKIIAAGEDWKGRAGLVDRVEGILTAVEGRPFANHFQKAIAIFKRHSLPFEQAETLVSWGRALLCDGNRADADAMFDAAIAICRRCGAGEGYIDLIEKRRTAFPRRTINPPTARASDSTFRREGDFWTIAHNGKTSRLRNIKGLVYVAHLLGRPGERVHVIGLVQAIEGGADTTGDGAGASAQGLAVEHGLGDAGELLDAQALDEYRRRQSELRAELEAAQRDNDPGRTEAARHELELITDEIGAAVGQYGRGRKAQAHSERARSLVTKHIRSAIDLIRRNDPRLATHFDRSIQTGAHCAYLPETSEKITWQL